MVQLHMHDNLSELSKLPVLLTLDAPNPLLELNRHKHVMSMFAKSRTLETTGRDTGRGKQNHLPLYSGSKTQSSCWRQSANVTARPTRSLD